MCRYVDKRDARAWLSWRAWGLGRRGVSISNKFAYLLRVDQKREEKLKFISRHY